MFDGIDALLSSNSASKIVDSPCGADCSNVADNRSEDKMINTIGDTINTNGTDDSRPTKKSRLGLWGDDDHRNPAAASAAIAEVAIQAGDTGAISHRTAIISSADSLTTGDDFCLEPKIDRRAASEAARSEYESKSKSESECESDGAVAATCCCWLVPDFDPPLISPQPGVCAVPLSDYALDKAFSEVSE